MVVPLDVTREEAIREAFASVARAAGGLDLLVNNAGVADTAPALDTPLSDFDKVMDVNLRGVWACAVEAARLMKERGGDIVNIASILGLRVANNVAPYAVSKAGVVQMTKAWRSNGRAMASASTRSRPAMSRPRSTRISSAPTPARS